jgi:signal transduction histidine kinase
MLGPLAALRPDRWLGLPTRTARLRLTVLYSGMFLLLGTAVILAILLLAHGGSTVGVTRAVPTPGHTGVQTSAVQQRSADLGRLLAVSWVVLAVTAIGSTGLGWLVAGRVLRPLRQMAATARTISAGSLSRRLALTGPEDEIKQLGDTLDDLLARLEASFEAQRRFVANASHELRTPLTVERTLLQVALSDPNASAATLRATCQELLASGREHERLLEALLTLVSSERGLDHTETLDLAAIASEALLTAGPEIERRGLRLTSSLAPAPTAGDRALLERLIANLIDNAVRHNCDGGRVEVATTNDAGGAELSVSNTGQTVPPDQLERLFEPFQRLADGRAATVDGHHGLGLSIVRAIATAHGAAVTAQPLTGGGLAVTVCFDVPPPG